MNEHDFLSKHQPLVFSQMKKNVEHGRIAHAYLFEGEQGTGKHQLSLWLAKRLFCQQVYANEPCQRCVNCRRIEEGEHPNIQMLQPDGQTIKVEQIRQLQKEFTKKGFEKGIQIFVLQEAEKLNISAANSLLKFLEEPEGEVLFILETQNLGKILPTIQSRCQIIHFYPLSSEKIKQQLQENGFSKENANLLVSLTNSYQKAVEISQDEWFNCAKDIVLKWFQYLYKKDAQAFVYVQKSLLAIGKEKEQQQRILLLLLALFQDQRDQQLQTQLSVLATNQAIELILQAQKKLAANVSFQNVVEQLSLRILFD